MKITRKLLEQHDISAGDTLRFQEGTELFLATKRKNPQGERFMVDLQTGGTVLIWAVTLARLELVDAEVVVR